MEQNLPFDVDALLVFGKVVECRSLSKAAALLGMPKSTVSRKLSKLESDLGIKLLRKNTHQLTVTDLGEKIYDHGVKILTEANGVRALVEGSRQEPQGELRVAMPVFVGIDYASRVGAAFLKRYPHSRLDIRLVDDLVNPVRDGFDVVFGTGPLQDSTLIARKVFSLELFLCASPDFVRGLAEPITAPAQLNTLPFIDCGVSGGGPRKLIVTRQRRRCELSPPVRARQQLSGVQAIHPARTRHRRDAEPNHLHGRVARRQHRARATGMERRRAGCAHDISVPSVIFDAHQRVLRDCVRDHRRELGASLKAAVVSRNLLRHCGFRGFSVGGQR
jgi:DNA-binding transcriptional LysR family regulator